MPSCAKYKLMYNEACEKVLQNFFGMRDYEINCEFSVSCGIMLVTGNLPKAEL